MRLRQHPQPRRWLDGRAELAPQRGREVADAIGELLVAADLAQLAAGHHRLAGVGPQQHELHVVVAALDGDLGAHEIAGPRRAAMSAGTPPRTRRPARARAPRRRRSP